MTVPPRFPKIAGAGALILLAPLAGCVLATNGLDYNRPMMPATEGGPPSNTGVPQAFREPVPFSYPGLAPAEQAAPAPPPVAAAAAPADASAPASTPAPTPAPATGPAAITISNFSFTPATLTVAVGSTVTWTNTDATAHAVRFTDQDGPQIATGASYSRTFSTAGSYTYQCSIHPYMTGTVVVQ